MSTTKLTKGSYNMFEKFLQRTLPPAGLEVSKFSYGAAKPITMKSGVRKQVPTFQKDIQKIYRSFAAIGGSRDIDLELLGPCFLTEASLTRAITKYLKGFESEIPDTKDGDPIVPPGLAHLDLCVDPNSGNGGKELFYFLFDRERKIISSLSAMFYITQCQITNPVKHAKFVLPIYEPTRELGYFDFRTPDGDELEAVNSYRPPLWTYYSEKLPDKLPREIEILFNQIKGSMDRKFFYHFLRQMLIGRNSVYLVLQGDGGTGKSIMKDVFRAIVGTHNYASGRINTLTGNFNSILAETKLVVFDELKYTQSEEAVMKEIPNSSISIEGKFKSATKNTKIFCSMMVMNNFKRDNYIAMDGRKFAPLRVSNKPLVELLSREQIEKIVTKCADISDPGYDEAYVTQIGRWILKHGDHSNLFPQGEYKGSKYWELAHSSLTQWQRAVANALLDPGDPGNADYRRIFQEGPNKFKEFKNTITKKGSRKDSGVKFPNDISAYREFLSIYKNLKGKKVFEVGEFDEDEQDFNLYILPKEEEIDL